MQSRQQKRIQQDKIALSISSSEEAALSISFYRQFVSSLLIEPSEGLTTTFELDRGKFESQNDCSMTSFRQKISVFHDRTDQNRLFVSDFVSSNAVGRKLHSGASQLK